MNLRIKKSGYKQDTIPSCYKLTREEQVKLIIETAVIQGIIAFCFYQNLIAFLLLTPLGIYYYKKKEQGYYHSKQMEVAIQFKEMITAMSTSLRAGYSIENACKESLEEMKLLYGNQGIIYEELEQIVNKLRNNQTVEHLFKELAAKLVITEIHEFAEILVVAKKYGGDLSKIIQNTSDAIRDKIDVNREIETIMSGKRTEQSVMNLMPLGIICYMQLTTPGFFDPLYHNLVGVVIMTICLFVYLLAYRISIAMLQVSL